jgi:hypothetical protein
MQGECPTLNSIDFCRFGVVMYKQSDLELIMLVRQAVEQMILNSESTIDPGYITSTCT